MTSLHDPEARRVRDKYRTVPVDAPASLPSGNGSLPSPASAPTGAPGPQFGEPAPENWAPQPARETPASRPAHRAADDIRETIVSGRTEVAHRGFRGKVNQIFGTRISKGASEIEYDRRVSQIRRTLRDSKRVGVISGKGAAGKTSTSLLLGATIASNHLGMKVVAMSIDPLGNIHERVKAVNSQPAKSVMSLAADRELKSASDVSSYLMTDRTGLRVLGSSSADGAGFLTEESLARAQRVLGDNYDLNIVDFGLNFDSRVYHSAFVSCDMLVLVASTTADSINELHTLIRTLKGIENYPKLLLNSVVVLTQTKPGKTHIDLDAARNKFVNNHGMEVIAVPYDEHIAEGGPMALDLLNENTRLAYVNLASEVMSKLPPD